MTTAKKEKTTFLIVSVLEIIVSLCAASGWMINYSSAILNKLYPEPYSYSGTFFIVGLFGIVLAFILACAVLVLNAVHHFIPSRITDIVFISQFITAAAIFAVYTLSGSVEAGFALIAFFVLFMQVIFAISLIRMKKIKNSTPSEPSRENINAKKITLWIFSVIEIPASLFAIIQSIPVYSDNKTILDILEKTGIETYNEHALFFSAAGVMCALITSSFIIYLNSKWKLLPQASAFGAILTLGIFGITYVSLPAFGVQIGNIYYPAVTVFALFAAAAQIYHFINLIKMSSKKVIPA